MFHPFHKPWTPVPKYKVPPGHHRPTPSTWVSCLLESPPSSQKPGPLPLSHALFTPASPVPSHPLPRHFQTQLASPLLRPPSSPHILSTTCRAVVPPYIPPLIPRPHCFLQHWEEGPQKPPRPSTHTQPKGLPDPREEASSGLAQSQAAPRDRLPWPSRVACMKLFRGGSNQPYISTATNLSHQRTYPDALSHQEKMKLHAVF